MDIEPGEALLAVTGVSAALAPGPLPLTVKTLGKAAPAALDRAARRRLRRFLAARGSWPEFFALPPFDYDLVLDTLPPLVPDSRATLAFLTENVAEFPSQILAESYMGALGRAVGYLQARFPIAQRESVMGARNVPPADLKIAPFRRALAVADNPLRVLDNLVGGILVADEVETMKALYPTLYAAVRYAVLELVVARKSDAPRWELSHERERKLRLLMGAGNDDASMRAAVRESFTRARGAAKQAETPAGGAQVAMKPPQPTRAQALADK